MCEHCQEAAEDIEAQVASFIARREAAMAAAEKPAIGAKRRGLRHNGAAAKD
ncbi:hypothetical protein O9Z70_14395 [Devosia sp. YIM 151766]|uniref:hypothetical protein n=1 Tax=Devosia sp. YIM 151766 TaxID=3017325 RepID=UPI00255C475F|nr:hypothetical protein [Devosia sp. YIM 151766]WIY52627.1 hypothetical protein O9Z70_14395 [Devosia sp. YIM 151766]